MSMLVAYDAEGNIIATLDYLVVYNKSGQPLGFADFDGYERTERELTEMWTVSHAKGSKVWPEDLSHKAHDYRVELAGPTGRKKIAVLVHKETGQQRGRPNPEKR